MKTIWELSAVVTKNGEEVDLGQNPRGGFVFEDDGTPLYAVSYDGLVKIPVEDITFIIEKTEDGREFKMKLDNWIENVGI